MNAGKIAEYVVGILVPLAMVLVLGKWAKALRILLVEARRIRSKARGRCPRFAPPFRIWHTTHPSGMSGNPAWEPSGRRYALRFIGSKLWYTGRAGNCGERLQSLVYFGLPCTSLSNNRGGEIARIRASSGPGIRSINGGENG